MAKTYQISLSAIASLFPIVSVVTAIVVAIAAVFFTFFYLPNPINHKTSAVSAQLVPMDTLYSQQKNALDNIQLESAWDISTGSKEIIVAIIDDAIDINHPDLRNNIDTLTSHDFVEGDNDPSPGLCIDPISQNEKLEQHGTQVAGIIGANGNNNLGISGINWQIKIMALRIGCFYPGKLETLAVKWAIEHGAQIINASYGGPAAEANNQSVIELLKAAGRDILFVTAAGNYHINNDDSPVYPGSTGLANVITVAASDANNQLTEWTQYGASSVDLAAPGVGLQTTIEGDNIFGDYANVDGSSFSTAVVSGVAALLKATNVSKNLSAADLKAILQASVTPVDGHIARTKTSGVLNARAALDLVNLPRPVMSITAVNYQDSGAVHENSLIDANETGNVVVELENLWQEVLAGEVSVSVDNAIVQLPIATFNLAALQRGERTQLSIPIQTTAFNGHQRMRFQLKISLSGTTQSASYQRSFEIQTGLLVNNVSVDHRIQQNNYDDYQYYHLNIPVNMERVSIELEYSTSDTRDMGLLAAFDQRPQIHFRSYIGKPYWDLSKYRSDDITGYESLNFSFNSTQASTLKIMVFNKPPNNPADSFAYNKNYKLKGCFYSENDGNRSPLVSAGDDRTVNPGDSVILTGKVSDSDGVITRSFWKSDSNIAFTTLSNHQIQFTAPSSGQVTFSFVAIDDGCKRTVDSVTISVKEISGNEPDGLFLNPSTLTIDENSGFEVLVSGIYNAKEVSDLTLLNAPQGVIYSNGNLSWQNAGPVGEYLIKFSAKAENKLLSGNITVNIKKRSVGNGGGGCVAMKQSEFDPLFLIYLFISWFFIRKPSQTFAKL